MNRQLAETPVALYGLNAAGGGQFSPAQLNTGVASNPARNHATRCHTALRADPGWRGGAHATHTIARRSLQILDRSKLKQLVYVRRLRRTSRTAPARTARTF